MTDIVQLPKTEFYGGEMPNILAAIDVDFPSDILWDDNSQILWDDGTVIEWSNTQSLNPDAAFLFSTPKTVFFGEAE